MPDDYAGTAEVRAGLEAASDELFLADAKPPEFSDEALALEFSRRHADDLRYVAAWSKWHRWTGTHWAADDTLLTFSHARAVCRAAAARVPPKATRLAAAVASAKTVAAVVSLARADRRHAATTEQWDVRDDLLNTPAGTIDTRTGALRPHRREDYGTKLTAASPGGECPGWENFLEDIFNGDAELIAYVQRFAGYCLTGSTREHALVFGYGTGRNGKSVLLGTIAGILGDYAVTAPMETFVATRVEHHPTDLAGLRGARLVTAAETEAGRHWAEAKVKSLTGGDRITARFMRQDFFEYRPRFKLFITGNNKPGLRGVDEAIRRRFHLLPFNVTIARDAVDPDLPEKLRAEWPGILAWMVRGCLDWRRVGLDPPPAVVTATEAYLDEEDSLTQWLAESTALDPSYKERVAVLYTSWKGWAEAAGEFAGSQKRFSQQLAKRGFARDLNAENQTLFRGLAVRDGYG